MSCDLDFDAAMRALAHPMRRTIMQWLKVPAVYFPEQALPLDLGVCAGQINKRAGLSQSTTSAHLSALQRAGLVTSMRVGQWILFKRNEGAVRQLLERIGSDL